MSAWLTLKNHYAAFEAIQRDIVDNSASKKPAWKSQLIQLRRDLQNQLAQIREALKTCEAAGADAVSCRALASEISKLRSAIASHQADWPAVIIDVDSPAYKASLARLRDVSAGFHKAAVTLIDQLKTK